MTGQTTRRTKTPAQRAQEAVDVLERRIARLVDKADAARRDVQAIDDEIAENERRLAYARSNPDLSTTPTAPEENA